MSEARNAILGYSEASPLYGLIIYRRRRILIKCIPDGTSRLLQGGLKCKAGIAGLLADVAQPQREPPFTSKTSSNDIRPTKRCSRLRMERVSTTPRLQPRSSCAQLLHRLHPRHRRSDLTRSAKMRRIMGKVQMARRGRRRRRIACLPRQGLRWIAGQNT